ncbi:protein phosphatase 2C domain-containing protein [Anaerobacillus alkaliphilus]|uniref:Protein phosphatase 2C domain-containing protein n=1 Tax=Anaerobacillus alkaliphilus TaxID=1548597 RepID=A0A4Q0VX96_9BACI|nr:protein phosphatase 2C domain-containing protein [Anaerobacillus alkaliphilus]RXJ04367.1 protein phosphatase 2C domain-containing protein [Anaerobacillus alkaliphilus]
MLKDFSWVGSDEDFIDQPNCIEIGRVIVGRHGGSSRAGQTKNEDGCLVWVDKDWEFAMILDAHTTAESAEAVVKQIEANEQLIKSILSLPFASSSFKKLESTMVGIFQNEHFLSKCENIKGETSCLIVVRKEKFLWWFSIGDCILFLFHHELATLGQYQLNQRQFYEWVGKENTFRKLVPCYSSGTRELRKGSNHFLLATDGLVECPNSQFVNPVEIANTIKKTCHYEGIQSLLLEVENKNGKDSTTIISWKVTILEEGSMPSKGE